MKGKDKVSESAAEDVAVGEYKTVRLKTIRKGRYRVTIRSISRAVFHKWSEKAKREMREKQQQGKKTKERELRNPEAEVKAATYYTSGGHVGISAMALKSAIISAAHKDIGFEKTLLRKAFFIICDDLHGVIPIEAPEPVLREDMVRVGAGSADLRYRPEFARWSCEFEFELDEELVQIGDILNLIDRAGFGVGIGEMRPEKGGDFGRFEVDRSVGVTTAKVD
jgi:hypothetical protein